MKPLEDPEEEERERERDVNIAVQGTEEPGG